MATWTRQRSDTSVDTASATTLRFNVPAGVTYAAGDVLGIGIATEVSTTLSSVTDTQSNTYDITQFSNGSIATCGVGVIYVKITTPLVGNNSDHIDFTFGATSTGRGCIVTQFRPPAGKAGGGIEASGGSASASAGNISVSLTSLTASDLGLLAVFNRISGTQPTTAGDSGFSGGTVCETILAVNAGWLSLSYGLDADTTGTEVQEQNLGATGAARWRAVLVKQVSAASTSLPISRGPRYTHLLRR